MNEVALPSSDQLVAFVERRAVDQTSTARLSAAIECGRELSESSDALIERFVAEARSDGLSWTQIGMVFGTSKQAAQKRYGAVSQPSTWPGPWTEEARDVLDEAVRCAQELRHDYLGTEHLLVALLRTDPGSVAGQVLRDLGVIPDSVLTELAAGSCESRRLHGCRLMPRLKQSLEYAQRIAAGLESEAANTEHLLAGFLAVPGSFAVRVLVRRGVTADAARAALAQRLEIDPQRLRVPRTRRRRLLART